MSVELEVLQKLVGGCPRCLHDEAEGGVIDHCPGCQRAVTAWVCEHLPGILAAEAEITRLQGQLARTQNEKTALAEMRNDAVDDRDAIRAERDAAVRRADAANRLVAKLEVGIDQLHDKVKLEILPKTDTLVARCLAAEAEASKQTVKAACYGRKLHLMSFALNQAGFPLPHIGLGQGYEQQMDSVRDGINRLRERADAAEAARDRLLEALTPSAKTKAAYMGEFVFRLPYGERVGVPWKTIKDIMATIKARAATDAAKMGGGE